VSSGLVPQTFSLMVVAGIAAFFVGLSKGGLPAIGSLAVPMMSLVISPLTAAALLLPIYVLTDLVGLWLYRRQFSKRNLMILIPAGLTGVVIGWATASYFSDAAIAFLIGLIGAVFCVRTWLRSRSLMQPKPADVAVGLFWGTLAGFTSFVSHSGAPPFQVYVLPQQLPKLEFAGTSTILFAFINAAKIIPYALLRPVMLGDTRLIAVLVPVGILGTAFGAFLTRRIPDELFFRLVQIALFVVSLKLMLDPILALPFLGAKA
jgi:uncharacterized protein